MKRDTKKLTTVAMLCALAYIVMPGGQLGASAPCPVASEASSLGHLSYHGNTWAVTGARLVTSSSDSSVKRLWQVWA